MGVQHIYCTLILALEYGGHMAKRRTKKEIEQDKKTESIRLKFTDWLYREYEISFLPKYFFINLDKVYKGTYKNLTKPVPVEDLWDMWKRKMPYLQKVNDKNIRMGKKIDGMARINYDMAIVLSKYDSYLEWKEQQQQALLEEARKKEQTVDYDKVYNNAQPVSKKNTQINIDSIIDEI